MIDALLYGFRKLAGALVIERNLFGCGHGEGGYIVRRLVRRGDG
jgi:hypothetical protein